MEAIMYDLIVIGGGPAGLTATIYALRKRLNVRLISKDIGGKTNYRLQLPNAAHHLTITGEETLDRFANELEYLDFVRVMDTVTQVRTLPDGYGVHTQGGRAFEARTLIIATGAKARSLNIPGEREFFMRGVTYSAVSYAPLFIEHSVVVIGDSMLALRAVAELAAIAQQVTLVAPTHGELSSPLGQRLAKFGNVAILENYRAVEFKGDHYARAVIVTAPNGSQREIRADGFFVELGLGPNTDFLRGVVALDANGRIEVDARNGTSAPGIFAAGDVTDVYAEQVLIAIGEGAKAALSACDYLLEHPARESAAPEQREWR
jgi:thioredoxin reductase